ncbi:unnamed protein product [Spirodela intermedia]|uniref:RRM domain-containing protein n=1 Tax=Spirodela intermedia TaxID=51605 RepID=A0A7I8IQU4_SPIIN|nr:unnamed protein product [Spirodela intermedia]CAA6660241.1 unnamed protein product [Spirodela intermedia]
MAERPDEGVEMLETPSGDGDGVSSGEDKSGRSSSSDSEQDEEAENIQIDALEKAVQENPANYEAHVQYIQCLRKFCNTEKLRQARKSMSELFPLSPKMWIEWANDEITLHSSIEAVPVIEEIYENGVHEYLSVPLWLDYLRFIEEHDQSVAQCAPAGVSKMRNLYERAISAAGLHVTEGSKIWDAYREFEEAILLTMDDSNSEDKAKQINRVRSLFQRQLSIPLADLNSTFLTYKQWEIGLGNACENSSDELDVIPKSVASAYQRALDMYNARVSYEDQLSASNSADSDRIQHFTSYIKFEDSSGHPARVQTLYERAISEFPISSDLWMEYTSYMDKTLKIPTVLKDVYSRATRNCSWIGTLWVQYLLSLERIAASEKELSAVFEQSLQCAFSSFNEYLDLFLTRVDSLRRRISSCGLKDDGLDYSLIRATFERATEYLSLEGIGMEDSLHLHDYWARLEMDLGKDLIAARGVWESLLKKSGAVLEAWKGYIDMEIRLGNTNEARSIYKRCYSKKFVGNGSEDICHSWLRFERQFGSLDDYDLAMKKVMPRLKELSMFRMQQASKTGFPSTVPNNDANARTPSKKRKMTDGSMEKQLSAKRQKDVLPGRESHPGSAQKSGPVDDTQMVTSIPTVLPKSNKSETKIEQAAGDSVSKGDAPTFYTDQCTVFVSNLSLEVNENHLREFFNDVGGVTAIRLLKDKFTGRPRGFAYVDFSDDEHLHLAIAKNRQTLLGKRLSIARSDPKQGQKKGPTRMDLQDEDHGRGERQDRSSIKSASHRRGGHVQLTGSATFAVPRSVRPLGWSSSEAKPADGEEQPKSNQEFRSLLMKK